MDYIEVVKQLNKKQVAPIYLVYGNESFFIQQLKNKIEQVTIDGNKDNLNVYDLEETPIEDVIADVETFPFFGDRKLIIANNASFLKAKPEKNAVDHQLEVLENYLTNPVDYSILLVVAPYEKLDERKKITKQLKKHAIVADCREVKEYELRKWMEQLTEQLKIHVTDEVYDMLESEISTNLHLLESELHKFSLYVGENGQVTKEIADNLMSRTATSSSLRLADAVMNRNLHQAIEIFRDLEKQKEEPIALVGLLAFQFRTLLRVKLLKQKGYTQGQMVKQLGAHPYVIKLALKREGQFSVETLQYFMNQLTEADSVMKQGGMEKDLAFEMLLYQLVQGNNAVRPIKEQKYI
ncbi:DNA polymerase III subunit delta [Virgibacillus pantothenticus]|uniref:DNA polymerase III subunit delta n=1 Tax=Virgibacillus pantothenticus TaxID=1473 RepID=A0A0L0QPN4_VIRPA|nr:MULTISPECIES: DNA polymerase III subunit delta [Virgibacillus]API90592.1 DNA polymerase III subunit delta [Virgibacillus sp. 6R]KNE20547.1 DNA polymerase III subunit delta [Virgibacillus pantothenticus]MBS7429707.1 DNA polymerase III subunit delta [Virgibacillus sp. 19R1-5]MBU8565582.1 DNA polymerase III subunit delta [Virgibacillus pantothenticus]MBU8599880.1 DNA polymerase III subunit delta [Virgibacillus pantothenticus]